MQLSKRGHSALRPRVAVDADGDALFAWQRFDGSNWRIQARALSAADGLGEIQTLSPVGENAHDPRVAVDADGDAVVTWRVIDAEGHAQIEGRARSAAGDLSAVQTLSAEPVGFTHDVAVDADGDAVFTWQLLVSFGGPLPGVVQARARSAAGDLSAVQTLSAHKRPSSFPDLAVDTDGDAVITWTQTNDAGFDVLRARARSFDGALSAVERISAANEDAGPARVAVDADGDAVFAWGGGPDGPDWILARTRSAAGALGPAQTLSETGPGETAHGPPSLAVNATGNAVVAWLQQRSGIGFTVQASAGP